MYRVEIDTLLVNNKWTKDMHVPFFKLNWYDKHLSFLFFLNEEK